MNPPLGRNVWHHGSGVLCCGTLRIAVIDIDTQPSKEFTDELLEWVCETLNAEASTFIPESIERLLNVTH